MTAAAENASVSGAKSLSGGLKRLGRTADGQRPAFLELDLPGALPLPRGSLLVPLSSLSPPLPPSARRCPRPAHPALALLLPPRGPLPGPHLSDPPPPLQLAGMISPPQRPG